MVDRKPWYVTALGQTDIPDGWRPNKANGGLVMDITLDCMMNGLYRHLRAYAYVPPLVISPNDPVISTVR